MSKIGVLRTFEGGEKAFWCPGCKIAHIIDSRWTFNGDHEKPTFSPSVLVHEGTNHPRCHSYVTDGEIRYLNDCTHELVGQTVALEPFDSLFSG